MLTNAPTPTDTHHLKLEMELSAGELLPSPPNCALAPDIRKVKFATPAPFEGSQ